MAYKALGWAVWKGLRLYLRRRFGGRLTKRHAMIAGGAAVAAAGVTAAGVRQAQG